MKFCKQHWSDLSEAIKTKGMWHLVPKSGEAAAEAMQKEIDKTATPKDYDPLMSCHWMIFNNALAGGGPYLMTAQPNGEPYCPLCEVDRVKPGGEGAVQWIEHATEGALGFCRENNLVGGVQ